jgi:hypothetical protein
MCLRLLRCPWYEDTARTVLLTRAKLQMKWQSNMLTLAPVMKSAPPCKKNKDEREFDSVRVP